MSPPVLVVEDDHDVRESVAELLRIEGFAVSAAADGQAALELLRSAARRPALILLDLAMPRMNGWQLLEALRGDPALRSIPVCTVSASDAAKPEGARDALQKPFDARRLLEVVQRYVPQRGAPSDLTATHRARMAELGVLAAGAAHEIGNALAYVTSNLALSTELVRQMGEHVAPAQRLELLDMLTEALEGATRVRRTLGSMKSLSRHPDEPLTNIDLRSVVETALKITGHEIRHRAVIEMEMEDLPHVQGDEARLVQVFVNLLLNAAHAIPEGRADQNRVRIAARIEGERVRVEVEDTGTGIDASVLPHIFEPFFTTKPVGVGTGLGLSIVQDILRSVGGEIRVESGPGHGTTFEVFLSVATAPVPRPVGEAVRRLPSPATCSARLAIVDDEPLVASVLRRALRDHDLTVCGSGHELLQLIQGGARFDAILCDLMMPTMSGMEVHETLSRVAPDQAARIAFVTGGAFTDAAREFLAAVPNPRVEKPFDIADVRALIQRIARRR